MKTFLKLLNPLRPCVKHYFIFFLNYLFILGCAGSSLLCRLFSSCVSGSYSLVAVYGLLVAVASFAAEQGFGSCSR